MIRHCFVFLCWLLWVTSAFSQCYDLRSTHLYEPQGRYSERWNKPLWTGENGNENFHVDDESWGRVLQFALFDIGIVQKTSKGWIQYRAVRREDRWCDPSPQRSGMFCYMQPYQKIPPEATIHTVMDVVERWSVSKDGIVHYQYHDDRGVPSRVENRSNYQLLPNEFGFDGKDQTDATLDLNTGNYQFDSHQYFNGAYIRRYPGTGVKLWRTDTFHATAQLREIPCPASLIKVDLESSIDPPEVELKTVEACVVKVKRSDGKNEDAWEFIQNVKGVSSSESCIQIFETTKPAVTNDKSIVQANSQR